MYTLVVSKLQVQNVLHRGRNNVKKLTNAKQTKITDYIN